MYKILLSFKIHTFVYAYSDIKIWRLWILSETCEHLIAVFIQEMKGTASG